MHKESSHCICQSVLLFDSAFKMCENYYPQVFLEECKNIVKEKEVTKYINDDLETSSDEEQSDDEYILFTKYRSFATQVEGMYTKACLVYFLKAMLTIY